jgi:hypothetical protein
MSSKRILLFSFLFLILAVSLVYYALLNVFYRLRIDPAPPGAYVVPWMRPNPSLEALASITPDQRPWDINAVMADALRLNITFRIPLGDQTRMVPSMVYLGHDSEYLYVGGNFSGIGPDPFSNPQAGYPNYFTILFDVTNSGVLTFPEAGSVMSVDVSPPGARPQPNSWASPIAYWYQDLAWQNHIPALGYASWDFADGYGMSVCTVGLLAGEYDNSTGTLVVVYSRHLSLAKYYKNSLQMSPGERWVMGFLLQLGFTGVGSSYNIYQSSWPISTYFWASNDSSWWPKLVIDLTNPPPSFST